MLRDDTTLPVQIYILTVNNCVSLSAGENPVLPMGLGSSNATYKKTLEL